MQKVADTLHPVGFFVNSVVEFAVTLVSSVNSISSVAMIFTAMFNNILENRAKIRWQISLWAQASNCGQLLTDIAWLNRPVPLKFALHSDWYIILCMRKVAIFDVDGTIFRSSLFIELVEAMISAGIFPAEIKRGYEQPYKKWVERKGSYDNYIGAMVLVFMKNIKGVDYNEFSAVAKKVARANKNKVYRYTRDLIKKLKKRGYFLLAISQSPKGILDEFCKRLGFNKIYGRFYELGPSDKFTGQIVDLNLIANKGNIVKRAVAKENLTLKDSYGIGDTEGDITMLEMVAHPICFNPNAKLYRYGKLNGWKIVVERKDVIYEIPN